MTRLVACILPADIRQSYQQKSKFAFTLAKANVSPHSGENLMAGTDSKSDHMADPRRWAEDPIGSPDEALSDLSLEEARGLIYELRIHETELMMQNEQLRRSQEKLQDSVEQYTDLYDFAPVGYITLEGRGIITEANLTVAEIRNSFRWVLLLQRRPISA